MPISVKNCPIGNKSAPLKLQIPTNRYFWKPEKPAIFDFNHR